MTAKIKILFQSTFYLFCLVLWLILVVLTLEFAAYLVERKRNTTNLLIASYIQQTEASSKECILNIPPAPVKYPAQIGGWDTTPSLCTKYPLFGKVLASHSSAADLDAESRAACRKQFSSYTTEEKEAYARLCGEIVLIVDASFNVHGIYGIDPRVIQGTNYLLLRSLLSVTGQFSAIKDLAAATVKTQRPHFGVLYLPTPNAPKAQHQLEMAPIPETNLVHVFMDVHPASVYAPPVPQPAASSRWKIPFFRYKAHFSAADGSSFKTNNFGFRGPEIAVPKPEGVFRILCIGGSTTDEAGRDNLTYPMKLEMLCKEAFPEYLIEVVNAGTPGIYSQGHLLRLPEYLKVEPNLVILHLGVNDALNIYDNPVTNMPAKISRFIRLFLPAIAAPSLDSFQKSSAITMGRNIQLLSEQFQHNGIAVVFASMPHPCLKTLPKEQYQFFDYQGKRAWSLPAFSLKRYVSYINISNNVVKRNSVEMQAVYIPLAESMANVNDVYTDFCHMAQTGIDAKAHIIFQGVKPLIAQYIKEILRQKTAKLNRQVEIET